MYDQTPIDPGQHHQRLYTLPASAVLFLLLLALLSNGSTITSPSRIIFVSVLVAHLTPRLAPPSRFVKDRLHVVMGI